MKIDSEGNIYCCGPGGIHVFDPQATCLGVISMPEYTANFCFGDERFSLPVRDGLELGLSAAREGAGNTPVL